MDLTNIRPAMAVVGSDGQHVGTVDGVEHNRIKLRRNDPAAGGQHHWLPQHVIDRVEGDQVCLILPAAEAWTAWQGEAAAPSPRPDSTGMGDSATGTGGQSMAHQDHAGRSPAGESSPQANQPLPGMPSPDKDKAMRR